MNNLRSKFYPIFQSLIFCALILFAFNFINEKPFIRMYKWPNFGDNYLAGLMFVSLFLIKKSLIKFNRSDKFFILIILYVGLMELFYFENDGLYRYSLMRDLFGIFYVFKVLGFIGIENIVEKLIKYSSIIFILLAIPYFVIYFSLHYYEYKFESIYYIDATLKNYFFFQVFFLFSICCFFQKKVLAIIFYFLCALILFYFPSRGQLLLFIIAIVPILLRYKFRIFFLAAHFIFTYLVFFAEYKESIKNTIVTKEVYVMNNVLEHLRDPISIIKKIKKILKKNGILFIEVPNDFNAFQTTGRIANKIKKQWWVSPPAHLNYFSHDTLENFLNKNNFSVVKRESSFPFEIFLLFGDNYVTDRTLGKECHKKRIKFEQNFLKTKNEKFLDKFYEKLAEINLGRTAIIYAKNK